MRMRRKRTKAPEHRLPAAPKERKTVDDNTHLKTRYEGAQTGQLLAKGVGLAE
jgi:hypothetical protein